MFVVSDQIIGVKTNSRVSCKDHFDLAKQWRDNVPDLLLESYQSRTQTCHLKVITKDKLLEINFISAVL